MQLIFKKSNGRYVQKIPVEMEEAGARLIFRGGFAIKDDIKSMAGAKWDAEDRVWTVANNKRNWWQIAFLMGENPYAWYDKPLIDYIPPPRECFRCRGKGCLFCKQQGTIAHFRNQIEAIQHGITRKECIIAAEMGLGKTLSAFEIIDYALINENKKRWLFVAPRSALASVQLENIRWRCKGHIDFLTYEAIKKIVDGDLPYDGLICDEASRVKNPTSQRSQAARMIADELRKREQHPYIILMSGTPAPNSPADWWHLCEIACPGFIKEGTIEKFKQRLGLIVQKENIMTGGVYPELVGWWDDESKCGECGKYSFDPVHTYDHSFRKSINEVAKLYRRMKGLVIVQKKADYLDLPDKRYEIIKLEPDRATLNAYELIKAKSARAIQVMVLSRELADGFQYQIGEEGEKWCPLCRGLGEIDSSIAPPPENKCPYCEFPIFDQQMSCDNCGNFIADVEFKPSQNLILQNEGETVTCPNCKGTKKVPKKVRKTVEVATPKIGVVKDFLDQYWDVGRFVIYAGFTGSIQRLKEVVSKEKWEFIKVDGHGWESSISNLRSDVDRLGAFQDQINKYPRICWIAHPLSGGMGLNLTASPAALYYSNDFNWESRAQSEDRIHRPGMDTNRGATIYDISYLPIDDYIRESLLKKKKLQNISMGELERGIKNED